MRKAPIINNKSQKLAKKKRFKSQDFIIPPTSNSIHEALYSIKANDQKINLDKSFLAANSMVHNKDLTFKPTISRNS